jgi:glycosyltransferase involved in cell wall biosynthesis
MRVALVHDYLTQFGGAERVLLALMELFPQAPVFTLVYDPVFAKSTGGQGDIWDERRIRTSFLQRLPGAKRHHRYFPLLMPLAIEQFDFSEYDIVLSDTHSFGKGIITGPNTLHLSYCFTPTRYVWDDSHRYVREFSSSRFFQRFAPAALSYIRLWDYYAAQRVDAYLTLSHYVAGRIRKYYHAQAEVISPPVDVDRFYVQETNQGYYLIVSRLVPYKRIDIAIEACEKLGRQLVIVGDGPEARMLRSKAGKWTTFLGFVPDEKLPGLYAGARALLFPQEEDFGITPLEAAAAGKPTIAFGAGGALETVLPGTTGLFFAEQSKDSLRQAIIDFEKCSWEALSIRRHAEAFRREVFLQKVKETVHNHWMTFKKKQE